MIDYRLAVSSDLPQVATLLLGMMTEHGVTGPGKADLETTLARFLDDEHRLLLVAEARGRIVGTCSLLFSLNTWSASLACELQDIVVEPAMRDKDVGRGLVEAASHRARARGCTRLFLLTEAWNLDAHSFYRNLGLAEKNCMYFERDLRTDSA